jgi:hypothetical protein
MDPIRFILICLAAWMNRNQQLVIEYHVLFVIRLATREVRIVGSIPKPNDHWMKQIDRNLTDCLDGFLNGYKYLIHDRAPKPAWRHA